MTGKMGAHYKTAQPNNLSLLLKPTYSYCQEFGYLHCTKHSRLMCAKCSVDCQKQFVAASRNKQCYHSKDVNKKTNKQPAA